jgi:Flp pilus assembly protein TadB
MTLTLLLWAVPSLAALAAGVAVWYYRRKYRAAAAERDDVKRDNAQLTVTLTVERKISADRKARADKLETALLARQRKDHNADAASSVDDALAFLRGDRKNG